MFPKPRRLCRNVIVSSAYVAVLATPPAGAYGDSTDAAFRIVDVTPADNQTDVSVETSIQAHTSDGFDPASLTEENVRLVDVNGLPVPVHVAGDLGGVITLSPNGPLRPYSRYRIEIGGVTAADGRRLESFHSSFATSGLPNDHESRRDGLPRWRKTKLDNPLGATAIAFGPDRRLYLATWEGELFRYEVNQASGRLGPRELVWLREGGRIIGLAFGPDATAKRPVLWMSHDDRAGLSVDDLNFSGRISKLVFPEGGGSPELVDVIVHLPNGDHPVNQFAFGPDGRAYFSMGAITMLGFGPEERSETVLSASVLVADVTNPNFNGGVLPLDADTRAPVGFDPYADNAPLRIFATGIREAYDLCWHSNGQLYAGVNMNDTTQTSPAGGGAPSISVRPDEPLIRIVDGAYYGQPNPVRNEFVIQGGNPTAGRDAWEIANYPVGVQPNPRFDPDLLIYNLAEIGGPSANGCEEWRGDGPLNGRLLVCFYTSTRGIHSFAFSSDGLRVTAHAPLRDSSNRMLQFGAPLDLAIDHQQQRIYVADFADPRRGDSAAEGAVWLVERDGEE